MYRRKTVNVRLVTIPGTQCMVYLHRFTYICVFWEVNVGINIHHWVSGYENSQTSSRFLAHAASVGRFDWPELGKLFSPWRKFSFTLANMWQKMGKASIAHSRKWWCNGHSYCSNSSRHACFYSTTSVTLVIGENLGASLFPPSNDLPSL